MTKAGSASPRNAAGSLRVHSDFQRVFKLGARRRCGGLLVIGAPGQREIARVGIIASRKAGNAVVRNRIKRRLRAAIRLVGAPEGEDYVLIASPEVATVPFSTLLQWVGKGFDKGTLEENGK